ncbi:MAG: molybdopterin molybdotransferase MoeA [Pseudomonadota bacterium]
MIEVSEAADIVYSFAAALPTESVRLERLNGRVLAEPIYAERDQPPFDRVMMDGIAVQFERGRKRWRLGAQQLAGDPPSSLSSADEAVEIMTGAVMAIGADTVIPNERYSLVEDSGTTEVVLESGYQPERGQFIHRRASDHTDGTVLLEQGQALSPVEVAIIASAGRTEVAAHRSPRVAIVATGNELVAAGDAIQPHEIRLSNAPALAAAVQSTTGHLCDWHHLPDDRAVLTAALRDILEDTDILILSGGVSRGRADYVPEVLESLGVTRRFHRVRQKPGKPLWFGTSESGSLVFGLPGNPVSTLACFCRYVRPALLLMTGNANVQVPTVKLANDWAFSPAMTAFVPVVVQPDAEGQLWAAPLRTNTSGDFSALAGTHGFVELAATDTQFEVGRAVPYFAWR